MIKSGTSRPVLGKTCHVPPPLPKPASVVDNTMIDNSQSILHVNLSQHIVSMSVTVGLISLLLLCIGVYCIRKKCMRCLKAAVTPQGQYSAHSAAANYCGSDPSNTMSLHAVNKLPMGLIAPSLSQYAAPSPYAAPIYITNSASEGQSVSDHSSDTTPPSAPSNAVTAHTNRQIKH